MSLKNFRHFLYRMLFLLLLLSYLAYCIVALTSFPHSFRNVFSFLGHFPNWGQCSLASDFVFEWGTITFPISSLSSSHPHMIGWWVEQLSHCFNFPDELLITRDCDYGQSDFVWKAEFLLVWGQSDLSWSSHKNWQKQQGRQGKWSNQYHSAQRAGIVI